MPMKSYWSQYWKQGYLTSFGDDKKKNYEGVIKVNWHKFYENLKAEDKVLDIGTGNGALIELAISNSNVDCQFIGIDFAKLHINEPKLLESKKVEFKSNMNAEKLTYSNSEFSAIISQYALEYSDLTKSIPEVSRVLSVGGKFQFVCHHIDSCILISNKKTLKAAHKINEPEGLLFILKKLINTLQNEKNKSNLESESLRNMLNEKIKGLVESDKTSFFDTNFPLLLKSIFSTNEIKDRLAIVESFESEFKGQIYRLEDLCKAALDSEKKAIFINLCDENSLLIKSMEVIEEENIGVLGYLISGERK